MTSERLASRATELSIYVLMAILIGVPIGALFLELIRTAPSFDPGSPPIRTSFANTIVASAAATIFAILLGGAAAIALDRFKPAAMQWLRLGLLVPLLIPPFVTALAWRQAYGAAGLLQRLNGWQLPGLEGAFGVSLLLGIQGVPLAWLTVSAALQSSQTGLLERAARASGASPVPAYVLAKGPVLRTAIGAAAGLVYVASASDFGIPAVLGIPGRFPTVTTQIYQSLSFSASAGSFLQALFLAAALAVMAMCVLLIIARWSRPVAMLRLDVATSSAVRRPGQWARATASVLLLYITLTAIVPIMALLLVALTRAYGQEPVPTNWTLSHFTDVLTGKTGAAFARSVALATFSAIGLVLLGTATAIVSQIRRWGSLVDGIVALPFSIPGSTLAIGIILAFSRFWYGTLLIILLAYLARFWTLAERPTLAVLGQVGRDPVRAARASGAGPAGAWRTAVLPVARSGLLVGAGLVFLAALHELTVSSLLYAPGTETVAVVVLNAELAGDLASTAAIGVLLTLIVLLIAIPIVATGRATRGASSN